MTIFSIAHEDGFFLKVSASATIAAVKLELEAQTGMPSQNMTLLKSCDDAHLRDSKTVTECGLASGSRVTMIVSLRAC